MPTELLYLQDAYQKTAPATIIDVDTINDQTVVTLDRTLFYPQGGGQPADQGLIVGKAGTLHVSHVSYNGGDVQHKGKLDGTLLIGEHVELQINWELRYQHMQWHTAGHILDQAVKNVIPTITGIDGGHGIGKKLYVDFDTEITTEQLNLIQKELEKIIASDAVITTEMISYDEMIARAIKLPFDLPKNKPLRIVQIGQYPAMPDGGTQLKTTSESWPITVIGVQPKDGAFRVTYAVSNPNQPQPKQSASQVTTGTLSLSAFRAQLEDVKQQFATDKTSTPDSLQTKYLGKKGVFNQLAKALVELSPTDRKVGGQLLNEYKQWLTTELAQTNSHQNHDWLDVTLPGEKSLHGHVHPVSQAIERISSIFEKVGFTRVNYPEVDWDWYVFESLNMPPDHPARDEWETFFVDQPDSPQKGKMVLTTHTSNGQVHEMERLQSQPPIRMINISRCYRRQQDATHTQMFHQFEGLVVDKGITIQHLKGTLDYFAKEFFGPDTKSRIRPFHFQFTEPSFEVDFSCHICHGTGQVTREGETLKCKFCKSGWHEVGGAGMVHPNVLKAGGIDPEEYTGFAFGWGIERTYTLQDGLNIDDIRLFYSGELRFLEQF